MIIFIFTVKVQNSSTKLISHRLQCIFMLTRSSVSCNTETDNIYFVIVVKLGNRGTYYLINMRFGLRTFYILQFKLLQTFEKATFPLTSMVTLPKHCQKVVQLF